MVPQIPDNKYYLSVTPDFLPICIPTAPKSKNIIRPLVDGAVIEEQLPGTEFLPPAHFLPWAAARGGIFGPSHVIALGL
jgi:hypothetical protein